MKNLRSMVALSAIALAVASCGNQNTGEAIEVSEPKEVATPEVTAVNYAIQTEGDEITWIGFKTISNESHNGTIQVSEGEFVVEGDAVVGGSFVIDMNSIYNEDLPAEGDYGKDALVGHLANEDFFDVPNHPTANFSITGIEAGDSTTMVSGNLKMRGVENNITFPATITVTDEAVTFVAPEFTIDRTQWNVMYGSGNLVDVAKDKAIDNNIKLTINLSASK